MLLLLAAPCFAGWGLPVKRPVFPVSVSDSAVAGLKNEVALVMEFGPDEIADFIVPRTNWYSIDCPNCEGGNVSEAGGGWNWSPDDPDHVTCKHCGHVFPSDEYPLDRTTTVTDSTGQVHTYRYCEGTGGYKHYMQMLVENQKKRYMEGIVGKVARLYAGSKEEVYARQAARILYRLAEVYPHYSPHGIESWSTMAPEIHDIQMLPMPEDGLQPVPGLKKDVEGYNWRPPLGKAPYPYCSAMRGDGGDNWFYSEMPPHLAYAYDLVASSEEFDKLSAEVGKDVRKEIEDFFRMTANYARTFPIYLGNMDPSLIRGLAVIGRVIGEPEYVHDALRRVKLILGWQFYPDGIWREGSPSYHSQTVSGLRSCIEGPLKGYSDPEGYVNPIDNSRIDNLDAARDVPMLQESIDALSRMRMPNGQHLTIHDTWARASLGRVVTEARNQPLRTDLMWALGQAIVGLGQGHSGVQACLHFSGSYGHSHCDTLDLMLFGQGLEMLSDIGYSHTILRPLSVASVAHNLVVVDERDQRGADGYLMAWGVCGDLLRFCEAGGEKTYPGGASDPEVSQYRRAITNVALPETGVYVVDVFRVAGGKQHDWHLHGSADYDQTLSASVPLQELGHSLLPDGKPFDRLWTGQGQGWQTVVGGVSRLYGLFEDLQTGSADETATLTFGYAKPDMPALQTTLLGQPDTTLYCGTLPSIRRAKETNADIWDYEMPAVIARRKGEDLHSVFAAVHEPYADEPGLEVSRLELAEGGPDAVGIVCVGDGFTDYHLYGADASSHLQAADLPIGATARYAFVRTQREEVVKMVLVDGTEVNFGKTRLSAPGAPEGDVIGVRCLEAGDDEDAIVVDAEIIPREGNSDERVIIEFGDGWTYGLAVKEIRREGDGSVIVLRHRPGFELSDDGQSATHTHHPHRTMKGVPRFRLPNVVAWEMR